MGSKSECKAELEQAALLPFTEQFQHLLTQEIQS